MKKFFRENRGQLLWCLGWLLVAATKNGYLLFFYWIATLVWGGIKLEFEERQRIEAHWAGPHAVLVGPPPPPSLHPPHVHAHHIEPPYQGH
jgi:hypothetical protein